MTFVKFYFYLIAITLIQIVIALGLENFLPEQDVIKSILFLAILTALIYPIAIIGVGNKNGYTFISTAYIAIGMRFILSICYIIYYRYTRTTFETAFIFSFFISYIFYIIFEITSLTAKLRPDIKKKTSSNEFDNK